MVRRAPDPRGVNAPLRLTRGTPAVSGGLSFLESLYGRSAHVLLAAGRADITPIQSMFVRVGCIADVNYPNWSIILECDI